jgi:hypothetical protein
LGTLDGPESRVGGLQPGPLKGGHFYRPSRGRAYYDADTLDNPRGWLADLEKTPNAQGICYTIWQDKYALLADFGKLVSRAP